MKWRLRIATALAIFWIFSRPAVAQTAGPTASPSTLTFSYQVNSTTYPAAAKVTITLPKAISSLPLAVAAPSQGWLIVTPSSGHSPLTLSVLVNPTGLTPGNYPGVISVDSVPASNSPAVIAVTLMVSNPPSTLAIGSPSSNYTPSGSGAALPSLSFTYTTGAAAVSPAQSEIDVSTTGSDAISFNVTAGGGTTKTTGVWLRVNGTGGALPNLTTSGVALSGSSVPIYVTLDLPTVQALLPGSYAGTIVIAAANTINGSAAVEVALVVSAGPPSVTSINPQRLIAGPVINPIITIYGNNFFSTSVVTMQQGTNPPITVTATLLSQQVLQATINAAYLAPPSGPTLYPIQWSIAVTNPAPPNNPGQSPATIAFYEDDPTQPGITSIVNAASFLATSVFTGTGSNPVNPPTTPSASVAPREIISIFGRNLGPASVSTAPPSSATPSLYPTAFGGIQVVFSIPGTPSTSALAPIIMISSNQINAIVPVEVAAALTASPPVVTVQVVNGSATTLGFDVTVIPEDPGTFTFGGLGQGQGAVLNFDSTSGSYVINSSKTGAPLGSTVSIYATGLGDFVGSMVDGEVATGAVKVADATVRVDIAGQPSVVTYAGTSGGSVAGLVQINAIVPPTVPSSSCVSLAVSIGAVAASHKSQPDVTLCTK
jgi:uncharacterized protein (TIGR03437 family)